MNICMNYALLSQKHLHDYWSIQQDKPQELNQVYMNPCTRRSQYAKCVYANHALKDLAVSHTL